VRYDVSIKDGRTVIHIRDIADPVFGTHVPDLEEVRGITFYVKDPNTTTIDIGDAPVPSGFIQDNPSDGLSPSIGVTWFPANTTNDAQDIPGVY